MNTIRAQLKNPLMPGVVLVALLLFLGALVRQAHREPLPRRIPKDTVAILEISSQPRPTPETIAQVVEVVLPSLRDLDAQIARATKSSLLDASSAFLEKTTTVIAAGDQTPRLTLILPSQNGSNALRNQFEAVIAETLARLKPTYRPTFLPDHSFASEQIADPTQFPFYPYAVVGKMPRVLQAQKVPAFASLDDGTRLMLASEFEDLRTMLGAPGTASMSSRARFTCLTPAPGIKLRLNPRIFEINSVDLKAKGAYEGLRTLFIPLKTVKRGNNVIFPSIQVCP